MNIMHDMVLAVVQGITEFLPISSSAHLILLPVLLGWEDHSLDYDIALHAGTLCAVLWYFRSQVFTLINPLHPTTKKLILATIPVCLIGLIAKPYIESYLRDPLVIAYSTIIFGLLLAYSQYRDDKYKQKHHHKSKVANISEISYKDSFLIGLAQAIALIPGTSRAGITMTAALLLGLGRKTAAEYSFLLSIPVIALASGMLTLDIIKNPELSHFNFYSYFAGFAVSAIIAMITMHFFIKLVEKIGMIPFVIYRLILGVFLFYMFY
jgi:undecaprenyl-diphosphatase